MRGRGARPRASRAPPRGSPAPDRRLAGALMAGDQQHDPLAARDRLLQRRGRSPPRAVEVHPVQVDDAVGLDARRARSPVPAAVERRAGNRRGFAATSADWRRAAPRGVTAGATSFLRLFDGLPVGSSRATAGGSSPRRAPTASASSGVSDRTGRGALGKEDQRLPVRGHSAGGRVASGPAPQKVSKRLGPLIAPPVSCATHRPSPRADPSREDRRAERHELGIGGDGPVRRHRHVRARRAAPARSAP